MSRCLDCARHDKGSDLRIKHNEEIPLLSRPQLFFAGDLDIQFERGVPTAYLAVQSKVVSEMFYPDEMKAFTVYRTAHSPLVAPFHPVMGYLDRGLKTRGSSGHFFYHNEKDDFG